MIHNAGHRKKKVLYQFRTFGFAFKGIRIFFLEEAKSKIHLFAAIVVIAAAAFFEISTAEWLMLVFAIGLVFVAEIFNTAIEQLVDHVNEEVSKLAGKIKDLAAAAVLIASVTAFIIGLVIFIPKIRLLF